ncbi:phosphoglycolate phosphatase [Spirochaetia bacterium]|nr:phosphoglycolate phosphatase [Spirochaetia bacterium]
MLNTIIFDMDGVLIDGSAGLKNSLLWVTRNCNLRGLTEIEMNDFFRVVPLQKSFVTTFDVTSEDAQRYSTVFREYYKQGEHLNARLYDGVYNVLAELISLGMKLGIATYKREDYALDIIRHFELDKYCMAVFSADAENRLSKADIIFNCLKLLSADPKSSAYVGDTVSDAKATVELGMNFIASTYGFGFLNEAETSVYNPFMVIDDIRKLAKLLPPGDANLSGS